MPFEMRAPNALTAKTLAKSERGEDVHHAKHADDLFKQLGI
ncbi:MAG: type II toxin-antitoxin system RelB/DinJ family antitoxin [Serpentinimonas sp.]|nr:type II toxin-antitoxin system RelB/DinJ family antitoxin [Serpentinimonas sp.]